ALVECDHHGLLRNDVGERDRFLQHAPRDLRGLALADLDDLDLAQADGASTFRDTVAKPFGELAVRPGLEPSDRGPGQPHDLSPAVLPRLRAAGQLARR